MFVHLMIIIIYDTELFTQHIKTATVKFVLKVLQKDLVTGLSVMTATVVLSLQQQLRGLPAA